MLSVPFASRCAVPFALTFFSLTASAQSRKVNDPLPSAVGGDVLEVEVSPDGAWTVCKANPFSDVFQLFSVPTRGGTPVELGADLVAYYGSPFRITADSRFVVYAQTGLYRVPIDGSRPPEKLAEGAYLFALVPDGSGVVYLSPSGLLALSFKAPAEPVLLTGAGNIQEVQVSPYGSRAVYRTGSADTELYGVPLDGSLAPVVLSAGPAAEIHVRSFSLSADGGRVVFLANLDHSQSLELCSAPVDGSSVAVKLNEPLPPQGNVTHFDLAPDGQHVVYRADQEQDERFELYGIPITGGVRPTKLNGDLIAGGDVAEFALTPDGRSVLYTADQVTDGQRELFLSPIEGGSAPLRLNDPLPSSVGVGAFRISVDGGRVVFLAGRSLRSASLRRHGGTILLADGLGSSVELQVSPDGRAVYRNGRLFSVPLDGGAGPRRLDDGGRLESGFRVAPEGTVLYQADRDVEGVFELFGVPADGSRAPVELGPDMDAGQVLGDVSAALLSPDGKWALYSVETRGSHDNSHDVLYSARLEPRARAIRLFPRTTWYHDDLHGLSVTPDGRRVVFLMGNTDGESTFYLFGMPIDGRHDAVQLNELDPLDFESYGLRGFVTSSDGRTVFYGQGWLHSGVYRAPTDGSSPPSVLPGSTSTSGDRPYFELGPDGRRVVFLSDSFVPGENVLSSVLADGSAPAVALAEHASPGFLVSPDGARVVFAADPEESVYELYSAPIDGGSAPPIRLSGTLVTGGDVLLYAGFTLTPDGNRAVYLADAVTDEVLELFSVALDGSAPPVRLDPAHALAVSQYPPFRVAPDGSRVVYRTDQGLLFSVAADGASPPVRLDGPLVPGGHVSTFELSADGARVVFRADRRQDEVFELYSIPIDASAPALQITGPHVAGGDVREVFQITPDGEQVVFVADHDRDEQFELYAAPIDRAKAARKLNGPPVENGDVLDAGRYKPGYGVVPAFQISADSERVLYLADQDTRGVLELYESSLTGGQPDGGRPERSR